MADTDTTEININIAKEATLEFEVHIQGTDDDDMSVRMILKDVDVGCDLSFACKHVEDSTWTVTFPPLTSILKRSSYPFVLEVVVDGYYFDPANGTINCMAAPTVDMDGKKRKKPTVKAAFTVKQDDAEPVKEGVAGSNPETASPTNALLTPEAPPPDTEPLTRAELAKREEAVEEFDPSKVAGDIIRKQMKKVVAPTEKGFLFSRDGGKAHVEGLESKEAKQRMADKAAKVKQILAGD